MRRATVAVAIVAAMGLAAPPAAAAPSTTEIAAQTRLYALIDAARASRALGPLTPNAIIEGQSYAHSARMARRRVLSHKGFGARVTAIETADPDLDVICENVAFVSGKLTSTKAANKIYRGWKRSRPHKRCMFDSYGSAEAAGIGVRKRGGSWWATFIAADDATP